ncbi:MAG: CHAD domain-containing protein [Bacteroidota bacterium]|nr:CHAD domain-containing protein [Bacteroidota bacterium]MDP4250905.1 CHAD domain-containing protein [Bacteroidota bacterium]
MEKLKVNTDVIKRLKDIKRLSRKIHRYFEADDIHVFRTETKKLRALLRLVGTDRIEGKKPALPKHLKDLYRVLGAIRSLQLQQQNISAAIAEDGEGGMCRTYLNLLNAKEAGKMIKAETLLINKKALQKEMQRITGAVPKKIGNPGIDKFIKLTGNRLQQLANEEILSEESLHMLRKSLKDLLYCWSYIKADLTLSPAFPTRKDIRKIVDLLGDFRDILMGIVQLDSDLIYINNESERTWLLNIRTQWQHRKDEIKRQVNIELPKLKFDSVI